MSEIKPLVAIHCLVYNHEPYLRDCFEGFVMQQTNFPFVAIVHDDASTDGSAEIIREYEKKYPHIFKPLYEDENLYKKGGFGAINEVMNAAIDSIGAKYIAFCEGDDYWIDSQKLQKQVDFLEANEEYSICFHNVMQINMLDFCMGESELIKNAPLDSTIIELAKVNYIGTLSVMLRFDKTRFSKIQSIGQCLTQDYVLWMLYAEVGKIHKINDFMGVYRAGVGVWSNGNAIVNSSEFLSTLWRLWMYFDDDNIRVGLQEQIENNKKYIKEELHRKDVELSQVRFSHAYRYGKIILKPFSFIKKMIK